MIGPIGMRRADRGQIIRGHGVDRGVGRHPAIEPLGLDCVDGTGVIEFAAEAEQLHHIAADAMDDEERRALAIR